MGVAVSVSPFLPLDQPLLRAAAAQPDPCPESKLSLRDCGVEEAGGVLGVCPHAVSHEALAALVVGLCNGGGRSYMRPIHLKLYTGSCTRAGAEMP